MILGHDYLFFASIEAYSCPWEDLLDAVKQAIGDSRCYKREVTRRDGGGSDGDYRSGKFDKGVEDQRRPRKEDYRDRKDYRDNRDYKDRKDRKGK